MKKSTWISIIILLAFIAFVVWLIRTPARTRPSVYDSFATCIKDSGATFYGAFWCPHCKNQKAMFGTAQRFLPYVECSNPDGKSQNETCNTAGVESYPTWVFQNGTRLTGEVSLEELSKQTQCVLPQ
jgi:hypothetical protein